MSQFLDVMIAFRQYAWYWPVARCQYCSTFDSSLALRISSPNYAGTVHGRAIVGTWTRWWCGSAWSGCTSGAPSIMTARYQHAGPVSPQQPGGTGADAQA